MMQWVLLLAALMPGQASPDRENPAGGSAAEKSTLPSTSSGPILFPPSREGGDSQTADDPVRAEPSSSAGEGTGGGVSAPSEESMTAPVLFPSSTYQPQQPEQPEQPEAVPFPLTPVEVSAPFFAGGPAAAAIAPSPPGPTPPLPDRWWLMREVQGTWLGSFFDDNRFYMTGWIEQSFTGSTDAVSNGTVVWNDRANRYLLQQAWVRIGRSVVTSGTTEPSFGFQIDDLNGSDYRFTLPRGLWNSQLDNHVPGSQNLYGVDLIQEYVAMYVPTLFRGVEFRVGRLYTPWGVESLEAVSTPLLSRSYAFNWSPPFTHCGGGAYVTFSPTVSGVFLLTNGNDVFWGDPSEELRFVGNLRWVQPGGRNTVTFATSLGRGKFNPAYPTPPQQTTVALATEPFGRNNFNAFDLVYTHLFNSVMSYNLEAIYGYQINVPQAALAVGSYNGFANWFSAAHYLFWTLSPKWSSITRFETFDDAQGQRTGFAGTALRRQSLANAV
jgi:hypothetical protein